MIDPEVAVRWLDKLPFVQRLQEPKLTPPPSEGVFLYPLDDDLDEPEEYIGEYEGLGTAKYIVIGIGLALLVCVVVMVIVAGAYHVG